MKLTKFKNRTILEESNVQTLIARLRYKLAWKTVDFDYINKIFGFVYNIDERFDLFFDDRLWSGIADKLSEVYEDEA